MKVLLRREDSIPRPLVLVRRSFPRLRRGAAREAHGESPVSALAPGFVRGDDAHAPRRLAGRGRAVAALAFAFARILREVVFVLREVRFARAKVALGDVVQGGRDANADLDRAVEADVRAEADVGERGRGSRLGGGVGDCLLYTSPSPRDATLSRMPSSA